jgi:large repetitive protein
VTDPSHRRGARGAALGALTAAAALAGLMASGPPPAAAQSADVTVKQYDLGVVRFAEPGGTGRFARIPVKIQGVVGIPADTGPAPVVVIGHGRHGDGCLGEYAVWPCFSMEQRNDLGMTYLVRALARAGVVTVAPDVNAAYTGGFGEPTPAVEHRRFDGIVDTTLADLETASAGGAVNLPATLVGRVDATRIGVLGHSRGGMNVLEWAGAHTGAVRSVVLVAPYFDPAQTVPDVPATLLLGTCDRDTGTTGAGYLTAARTATRTAPSWRLVVRGANHNAYNRTLVRLRMDDAAHAKGACAKAKRPTAAAQQSFLARVAGDHFAHTLLGAPAAAWRLPGTALGRLYGQRVALSGSHVQ